MTRIFLILILLSTAIFGCVAPKTITEIPKDYIGSWQGEINLELFGNANAVMNLSKDSMKINYDEFGKLSEIKCEIEKIEVHNRQKCNECNNVVLTIYYKTYNSDNSDYTPHIDQLWLSDQDENVFNSLHIDKNDKGEVIRWNRVK